MTQQSIFALYEWIDDLAVLYPFQQSILIILYNERVILKEYAQ